VNAVPSRLEMSDEAGPAPPLAARFEAPFEAPAASEGTRSLRSRVILRSRVKRAMDVTMAAGALAALGPVMAVIAVAIRTTMGPPVLFRQSRPGLLAEPFEIVKFRSMRTAAGPDGRPLPVNQRLTKLGAFLRRTSLDELPELWNVLKGEMSLVGPRPLLMEYLPRYAPEQARRHDVKPGLTGLAQVSGRHLLEWDDRFRLDLRYIESWSLALDLSILRSTILQVATGRGLPPSTAADREFIGSNPTAAPPVRSRDRLRTAFLAPGDPSWEERLLGIRHDVYHLPEYARFASRWHEAGEPVAFVAEEPGCRFFVPLILRPIPFAGGSGLLDAVSPRGYPGPLLSVDPARDPRGFAQRATHAFVEKLRERGVVSAFLRLHPLLMPPGDPLSDVGTVVTHGQSVSVDLSLTPEELWLQTRQNHRRDIRRTSSAGYTVRIDEDWEWADAFGEAYRQSMDRLGADPFWRLTPAYFTDLRAALGSRLHLCVAEIDGELAAGALFTEVDGLVEYHLAGTADAHVAASPSKLIIDFGRTWARARGDRLLHLAGSLRPDDTLIRFKLGFSPLRHAAASWRIVADPEAYRSLSGSDADAPVSSQGEASFFPAYRRPSTMTP
jgi:lipopolysaccharide/colanic/teichoic acid biosynthesis glycosyltransferase